MFQGLIQGFNLVLFLIDDRPVWHGESVSAHGFVRIHAQRFDYESELLDFRGFRLGPYAELAGAVEVAHVVDSLHPDVVVGGNGVPHPS